MSLTGLIVGLLNIVVVVVALGLVGAVAQWVLGALGWPPPQMVQRLYIAVAALIALVLFVRLVLGAPFGLVQP